MRRANATHAPKMIRTLIELVLGHIGEGEVGWAAAPVVAQNAEAPLLVGWRHDGLVVEVPDDQTADVRRGTRHLDCLDQEPRLRVFGDEIAVLEARRDGRALARVVA